ncbi:hypothetical protein CDAR_43141 [Caerostris darwini]|uniref:Uncharacterized protein n=1 Tax=Caerostris darwini TaxID=1538125 RepID=A0AAV4WJY4_9ARAC|nr:hypothetical protein CDAR_43141 [Caerostris darwini]
MTPIEEEDSERTQDSPSKTSMGTLWDIQGILPTIEASHDGFRASGFPIQNKYTYGSINQAFVHLSSQSASSNEDFNPKRLPCHCVINVPTIEKGPDFNPLLNQKPKRDPYRVGKRKPPPLSQNITISREEVCGALCFDGCHSVEKRSIPGSE